MISKKIIASLWGAVFIASLGITNVASAFTASCVGVPSTSSITWTASTSGDVTPTTFLWGNGSTGSTQNITVVPGIYGMTLQATDASSTIATTTCGATVLIPAPVISTFLAVPSSITLGQSSVLSWGVANTLSVSIDNVVGTVTGTSATVTPAITTTYRLTAVGANGTTSANTTVTVVTPPPAPSTGTDLRSQILNILKQIAALKMQLAGLVFPQVPVGNTATSTTATTTPTCFIFNRDLHDGDSGDDVRELQRILASDPTLFPPGFITGHFGHKTKDALKKFQRKNGIFVTGSSTTGFFGPMSRKHLEKECRSHRSKHDDDDEDDDRDDRRREIVVGASSTVTVQNDNRGNSGRGKNNRSGDNSGHGKGGDRDRDDD